MMKGPPWGSIEAAIAGATPDQCRRIAIAAASRALEGSPGHPALLDKALREAHNGAITADLRAAVQQIADDLDDRYLDLHDDEKPGGQTPGWEAAFRDARAATAVANALDPDPVQAVSGATYEALAALDEDLLPLVNAVG